ncbi:MAG: 2-C-methyl-D-erythritol 4-phosphate cytidylyltransferase, partial [Chloroflexota bacterium]|nr:2-C-methyl-D-erythritol 4-phosphate cytidylyltransferase [Chloroflexota bacterium]
MRIHALLLAGGDGNRFGADIPKQFVRLAGEQILVRSARGVAAA